MLWHDLKDQKKTFRLGLPWIGKNCLPSSESFQNQTVATVRVFLPRSPFYNKFATSAADTGHLLMNKCINCIMYAAFGFVGPGRFFF